MLRRPYSGLNEFLRGVGFTFRSFRRGGDYDLHEPNEPNRAPVIEPILEPLDTGFDLSPEFRKRMKLTIKDFSRFLSDELPKKQVDCRVYGHKDLFGSFVGSESGYCGNCAKKVESGDFEDF